MFYKFHLLILACLFLITPAISQTSTSTEPESSAKEDLLGYVNRKDLQSGDFGIQFRKYYSDYTPEQEVLNDLKTKIYTYKIKVVMATWCSDSQMQVPQFYKILDQLDYNTNTIEIICLDREKSVEGIDISSLNIERVPTFIFYKDDVEQGRIIETPKASLEKDALMILNKK